MIMWKNIKNLLQQRAIRHYCALVKKETHYFLAAIEKSHSDFSFETFASGSLIKLINQFHHASFVVGLSAEHYRRETYFFPKHFNDLDIYQSILDQQDNSHDRANCDFEILASADHQDEHLVISYFLKEDFLQEWQGLGIKIAALEPLEVSQKRALDQAWQQEALANFAKKDSPQDLVYAEMVLRLLDRDNFYGA